MFHLLDFIFPPRVDELTLRHESIDTFLSFITPKLVDATRPPTVTLLPFHEKLVRAAIHEAKYHGSRRAFEFLGHALADYLRDCDDVGRTTSNIVPVPLGPKRLKERGFNQVEMVMAEALRAIGTESKMTMHTALLVRTRDTASQVSLPRHEREVNMRNAFRAAGPIDSSHTYIVVDDVLTTGATLQAAIDALRDAGATHIIPLALAH